MTIKSRLTSFYIKNIGKNLAIELQLQARSSSAEYISTHMLTSAIALSNKKEILKLATDNITLKDGFYAEFGVYKGKSIKILAALLPNKQIFGFDSFAGLPEDWTINHKKGHFALKEVPSFPPNVTAVVGLFQNSLKKTMKENNWKTAALLHLDADLFSSTQFVLKTLKKTIKPGTIIIFDEYLNYPGWQNGEFLAWKNFCKTNNIKYQYLAYNRSHEQVVVKIVS